MEILHIKTPNGSMKIATDNFFPCSKERFNKLFKVIRQCWDNDIPAIKEILKNNFQRRIREAEEGKHAFAHSWDIQHQKRVDLETMIREKKRPSGVRLTKKELKDLRADLKTAKQTEREDKQYFKDLEREAAGLKKNLEMLAGV